MTEEKKESGGALAVQKEGGKELAPSESFSALQAFQTLAELAVNPDVDAEKMSALADVQMKMMDYAKREEFNKAKNAAVQEMPTITKNGAIKNKNGGVQSRYSRFEDIYFIVKPILQEHDLALTFKVGQAGNMVSVTPVLSHANGFVEEGDAMPLPIDTSGSKNPTQGAGSAASYGKRHTMKAILNIVEGGEDDDGQGAFQKGGPPPSLSPHEQDIVDRAEDAAKRGAENYASFFANDLSAAERGYLVTTGRHDQLKQASGAE